MADNWWESDAEVGQQQPVAGPVTLGTPRPQKPTIRQVGNQLGIVGDDGSFTPTFTAPEKPDTKADDVKIQQKRASLQSLEQQINRVEELYRGGLKDEAFGIISSLGEFLPTETNRQFDAASAGLAEQGLSAFRVPGVGAQSDTELRQFVQANRPSASDYDATIEEKLRQLRVRVDATRQEMGLPPAQWLGQDKSRNLAEIEAPSASQLTPSTNGYQTVDDPRLAGVRGEYLRRLEAGQGPRELVAFLRSAGINDPKIFRSAIEQANFRRQNPNVPIANYNTDALDDMDVPLSGMEQIMNDAAQTPLGAYGMHAGQAASFNLLDEFAPNQERAQLALNDASYTNPISSTLGMISGGLMSALGGEAGLARFGMNPGVGRALLADVGYGAGAGAGAADDGNRLAGAATGGAAGLAGSLAGQGLTSAAGRVVGGVSDPSVRYVASNQTPLTLGQAVGNSGKLGAAVKGVEDRLSGLPVVGDMVNARRAEGVRSMNSKAFDKALRPIDESVGEKVGEEAVAEANDLVSAAFTRALSGKVAQVDRPFVGQATAAMNAVRKIPRVGEEVAQQIDSLGIFDPANMALSGENMQTLLGSLRQIRQAYRGDPLGHQINNAVKGIEKAVEGMFERQLPEVIPEYRKAKEAYRRLSTLADAVNRAKSSEGVFTPGQLGMADRANSKKFDGAMAAASGRSPFHDFQRAYQNVLPNRVPDSGTAGRLLVPGALLAGGGAGAAVGNTEGGAATGVGLATLLSLAYSRRGQGLLAGAAIKRGDKARKAGKAIQERKRLIGASSSIGAVQGTFPDQ
jgi:hypothetical protein